MQALDLALGLRLGLLADTRVKCTGGMLLKLFLPRIDLVRVDLIALR